MSEKSCCAHCRVVLKHTDHPDGTRSDYWVCDYGCGQRFEPARLKSEDEQMNTRIDMAVASLSEEEAWINSHQPGWREENELKEKRAASSLAAPTGSASSWTDEQFPLTSAEDWYAQGGCNTDAAEIEHRRAIQLEAIKYSMALAAKKIMQGGMRMVESSTISEQILTAAKEFKL